ncbi:uncharacterized protein BDZ83DRAFT_637860 [Colletotrichum acutatum]|uniref:Uncharacterized protein n=1 Tax=Glomerella acutata TaxID=27357 RepID=A0AAD8XA04_GLOAC|nr:uncharacterized protein BDZ83DRAFT_637860 [Colletotrichum acutatum]KAK1713336.1 hypothetical protein BDZ83DRAFT_637860 [Colletotrichum acutatum]
MVAEDVIPGRRNFHPVPILPPRCPASPVKSLIDLARKGQRGERLHLGSLNMEL